jgi:putative two-component system response regulator
MIVTPACILIVDDETPNRLILEDTLQAHYVVHSVADGEQALAYLAAGGRVDLVLSDVVMPRMDGYELCRRLKANAATRDIPLLFLSMLDSPSDEAFGLVLGAEDFIHKPISPPVVQARVRNHLELARTRRQLRERAVSLEQLVEARTQELSSQRQQIMRAQTAIISIFCTLAEFRDNETGHHILRTQRYVEVLARHLQKHPRFAPELDDEVIALLFRSAPLHDIGKIGIPDAILLKPHGLSQDEWQVMRRHAEYGRDAIIHAQASLGDSGDFLRYALEIAHCHHEKWDGSGYPQGLVGDSIPLSARLMAVADVYDALISRRPYKEPFPHAQAMQMIRAGSASHFDPDIVEALDAVEAEVRSIAATHQDVTDDPVALAQVAAQALLNRTLQ